MATKSQRKAPGTHRRRAVARGLVRVEVQAPKKDAGLIRALAETLRDKSERADTLHSALANALLKPEVKTAFDVFGSELPDEAFSGVFDCRGGTVGARSTCEISARYERHLRGPQA